MKTYLGLLLIAVGVITASEVEEKREKRQYIGGTGAYGGSYGVGVGSTAYGGGIGGGCLHPPCVPPMGYYTQECNANKPCPKSHQFCQLGKCIDKLEENVACTKKGQCKDDLVCLYGRCKKGEAKSDGAFCTKHSECTANKQCCNLVPAINPHFRICVPKLAAGHQCGGYGFHGCGGGEGLGFGHHLTNTGDSIDGTEEGCKPCIDNLECKEIGLISSLMICRAPAGKK